MKVGEDKRKAEVSDSEVRGSWTPYVHVWTWGFMSRSRQPPKSCDL